MKREKPKEHYCLQIAGFHVLTKIKMHYSQLFMFGKDLY